MKARVIETSEIIDVKCLCPIIYSRLDCNGKIIEEYGEEELEFESRTKLVSLDKVCDYLKSLTYQEYPGGTIERIIDDDIIKQLRKKFE